MPGPTGEVSRISTVLLRRIVAGTYPPGLRLPPELSLADEFGCSRGTVREALRHLASMGVVRSRRGSGVAVLDFRREGNLGVLPAYLDAGKFDQPFTVFVRELLNLRRILALEGARLAATYANGSSLDDAKATAAKLREAAIERDVEAHSTLELQLFRDLLHASRMWPAVWLGNAFWEPAAQIHEKLAPLVGAIPTTYVEMLDGLMTALDQGDSQKATQVLQAHFEVLDAGIVSSLEAMVASQPALHLAQGRAS